ncbi:NAD(P)-dependent oxidoreductase [Limibacillus halophilus]
MSGKQTVGFIGVGLMGWGMAKNAVEKGFDLLVLAHRKREAVDDLVARGAKEVASAREMAEQADMIVLCVTGAPQVREVLNKPDGILAGAREGLTIIDTSTSEPDLTVKLHEDLGAKGITFVDAPLSRTPSHAWDGELTTFVGGPPELVARIKPLLDTWAAVVIPTEGPVGSAHAIKLVNNLVSIGYGAIWSECFAMTKALGLKPQVLRELVTNSGMNCGNFQNFAKYICEGDPSAHKFTLANCLKDITYYNRMATANNTATLISDGTLQALKQAKTMGYGEQFLPEFVNVFLKLNGEEPGPSTD